MKSCFLACAVLLASNSALAQSAQAPVPPSAESNPVESVEAVEPLARDAPAPGEAAAPSPPQTGRIVMYRGSSIVGAAVACPIRYKGAEIVELGRGKFAEWEVPAGRYVLNNKISSIEVTVQPGERSYVRCILKMGFFVGRADLQIVDEESFAEHSHEFTKKKIAQGVVP